MQMPDTLDPRTAETRCRTASTALLESPAKFVSEGAHELRLLIGHRHTVSASDNVEHVFETFRHNGLDFLAVVDGERLLGMCSRHAIDSLLGGRYGFRFERAALSQNTLRLTRPGLWLLVRSSTC